MQYLLDFSIYKTKDTKNHESNTFDRSSENGFGDNPLFGKATNQGTSVAPTLLGMYLTMQSQLPALWKRLQENRRNNGYAFGGFLAGIGQCG